MIDIHSRFDYPSNVLSNFYGNRFTFLGVECNSMEGLLQAFKCKNEDRQIELCQLVGFAAKNEGSKYTATWQKSLTLWFKGVSFSRNGEVYQGIIQRAYQDMFDQSLEFRKALLSTGSSKLTHKIGHNDLTKTVLTSDEFCNTLMKMRDKYAKS